jgi:hypothetical protein
MRTLESELKFKLLKVGIVLGGSSGNYFNLGTGATIRNDREIISIFLEPDEIEQISDNYLREFIKIADFLVYDIIKDNEMIESYYRLTI